jgi:subtilisin-like proprotein convertase family protein
VKHIAASRLWLGLITAFSLLGSVAQGQTFNATGTGAIPDSPNGTCWTTPGTSLAMPIAVSGVGAAITNMSVSLTMTHTWVGDLNVTLSAPGGSPSFTIFGRTGSAASSVSPGPNCGYASNMSGTYVYADPSATSNNWWTAANVSDATNIATGTYFTTPLGVPAGAVPTAGTAFNAAFAGLTPAQINGTWTLTITDNTSGDTGSVTAASLTLTTGAPPAVAYAPAPNAAPATVTFATGAATITATPSGGSGSGAASTTTVNGCAISGVSGPGSFGSVAGVNLSFVGPTTTAQNIGLTCTGGTSATTASLSCNETSGSSAAVVRTWGLTCPAGNIAPTFTYTPAAGGTITATGGTTIGTTGNLTLAASIGTAGSGSGASATTTTSCTAPTAPFAGFAGNLTATGSGAISGSPLSGTCTLGASAVTQTLSCTENRGGTPTAVSFQLSCPAGSLLPAQISTTPAAGPIAFGVTALGTTASRTISITNTAGVNSNNLTVASCSINPGAAGFSLVGVPNLSLAPGATGSIVVNYSPTGAGAIDYASLTCSVGNVTGTTAISWSLNGSGPPAVIPTLDPKALAAMMALLAGLALLFSGRRRTM